MDGTAVAGAGTPEGESVVRESEELLRGMVMRLHLESEEPRRGMVMRLYLVRGSSFPSREQHEQLVACVDVADGGDSEGDNDSSSSRDNLKKSNNVLDVDLSEFVPNWFWATDSRSYSVVAAGDGLVCISNDSGLPKSKHYCLLNPITRTCVVLPPLPLEEVTAWYPPTGGGVTICGWSGTSWDLATYHHGTGCGGVWVVTQNPAPAPKGKGGLEHVPPVDALLALGGGQTYRYDYGDHRVHVLAPGGDGQCQVEISALDTPRKVTLPGRRPDDAPAVASTSTDRRWKREKCQAAVVAHRGAVYLVGQLVTHKSQPPAPAGRACCVWLLLAGDDGQVAWEPVAVLDGAELRRLAGLTRIVDMFIRLHDAYAVRELLCCQVSAYDAESMDMHDLLLGFDLDTGRWELVHGSKRERPVKAMELRPDLFVS